MRRSPCLALVLLGLVPVPSPADDDPALKADYEKIEGIAHRDVGSEEEAAAARKELREAAAGFVEKYRESANAGEGLFRLGMARAFAGERAEGTALLRRYLDTVPSGSRRKDAFLALLALLDALERPEDGLDAIEAYASGFKEDEAVGEMVADQRRQFTADAKRRSLAGQPAPEISITRVLGGELKSIGSLKGKVVLLDFFATWCPPCRATMPWLVRMQEKFGAAGLSVVGATELYGHAWLEGRSEVNLSPDREVEIIDKFRASLNLNYPVVLTAEREGNKQYGVLGIPTLFLIDRKGVVRKYEVGAGDHADLEREIEKCLTEKDDGK